MRRYINLLVVTLVLISLFVASIFPPQTASASPLLAVTISPTKTDAIINDGVPFSEAADGKADPGETIEYTVVIPNSGDTDATGVTFNDVIDLNTTLVGGSLNVSPLAVDDTYSAIGNTLLDVGVGLSDPAVHVTNPLTDSLLDNDIEFLGDTFTLKSVEAETTAPFTTSTEQGGSVMVESDGNFSYTPPVGFSGADHFDYVLTDDGPDDILDNADDLTGAGRVTINVTAQRVWYVKNDATPGGLGRSTDPFDTLVEAQAASSANDTIYVFQGDSTTTGQNAGITLKNGQRLLGEGVALTVPITSGSFNGVPSPTTITLRAVGTRPTIGNSAGDGVSLSTVSIGASFSAVEIRGLNISGTGAGSNAVDVTTNSTFGGSFELADNVMSAAGAEGIDVNGGGSAALTVNLHDNTVTATGNGIDIFRSVGAGNVNIIAFDDNVVTGTTVGAIGINIVGGGAGTVLFDTDPSTASYVGNTVSGGNTIIGSSGAGNGAGASGMVLNNIKGDLNFTDLDIYTDNGAALSLTGTTSNFLTSGTGARVTATTGTPTLVAVGGPALTTNQTNINIVPTTFSSTNSGTTGISLLETSGTLTAPSGSSITNATGTDFSVDGNLIATATVSVIYAGTITDDLGALVQIVDVTGGSPTYAFTGAITDNNDGDGSGISLTNNDSATIRFSGGLLLSTGSNPAFTATNGATAVEVCDENPCNPAATGALVNTLTSTTGTALNVANTTIGANKLEFRSINVDGNDSAPTNGIVLNNTGSAGGLMVKGTGSAGSGGTIQDASGDGISLNSTAMVSLSYINITSNLDNGIGGSTINGFVLNNVSITSNGDNAATDDSGIDIVDLIGSAIGGTNPTSITNSTISNNHEFELQITNNSGTLTDFQMSGNTISSNGATGAHGNLVNFLALGSANMKLTTTSGTFTGAAPNTATGIQCDHSGSSGTVRCNISGASFTNNNVAVSVSQANGGNLKFIVSNNTATGNRSHGLNLFVAATGTGTVDGEFTNNIVGTLGTAGSGSSLGFGIRVQNEGVSTSRTVNVLISGNTVQETSSFSLININQGIAGQTSSSATNATITGNNLINSAARAIIVQQNNSTDADSAGATCVDISGNTMTNIAGNVGDGTRIRLRRLDANSGGGDTFRVRQTSAADLVTQNPNTATVLAHISTSGTMTYNSGVCTQPNLAMLPNSNLVLAQNTAETHLVVFAPVASTNLNSINTLAVASESVKLSEQASEIDSANTAVNASANVGGGKSLFRLYTVPAQSETVTVPAFTLPAGKSVTIKFQVTVNDPLTVGTTQISNQGTISGSNFSNIQTDDPSVGGGSDPTVTPVDRPDANVFSINRNNPVFIPDHPTNADSVTWRVTFNTPVAALAASNFVLDTTGGSVTTGAVTLSGVNETPPGSGYYPIWDVTVGTIGGDGPLVLKMTNDTGLSHDVFVLPFIGETYTIDNTAPTVTSFTRNNPSTNPTNSDTLVFEVTFSEAITGFGTVDFIVHNNTPLATTSATPTSVLSGPFRVVISGGDLVTFNGVVGLDFSPSMVITDLAGNPVANTEPATDETYTVDNAAPTVAMSSLTSDPTNVSPIPVTAQFSETVNNFIATDIVAGNATVGNFIVVDGDTYTFTLTPSGQGLVTADIGAGVATDTASNGNTAATQFSRSFDNAGPTVTMSSVAPDPTNANPILVTVQFSEAVNTFIATDIVAGNATVGNFIAVDGDTYTFDLIPSGQGLVTADIAAGVAQDSGGNGNMAATQFTRMFDSVTPTVTMSSAAPDPTNTSPIPVTVQFSENVIGFDAGDITPGNATVGNFSTLDGDTYTFELTPSAPGLVTADIAAGVAQDDSGNLNSAASQFSIIFDSDAPTVAMSSTATNPTNTSPIPVTVQFSESVSGFDVIDITSGNGTVGNFIALDGDTYTFDLTPSGDGLVIAEIAAGVAQDGSGNLNSVASQFSRTFDTIAPTATIDQAAGQADPTSTSPIDFTVIFSEPVNSFGDSAGDVTLSGTADATTAVVTEIAPNDGTTYNVAVSGMTISGTVVASVPAGSALDAAGNSNTASTSSDNIVTFIADATPPSVSSVNRADPSPTGAASVSFTVTFSESVTGVDLSDFTLTTTSVSAATISNVSGYGDTYTVTVNTGTGNGTIRLDVLDDDTILDAASNPLAGGFTSSQVYTIDKSATIDVSIGGANQGQFLTPPQGSTQTSFAAMNTGPVKIESTNGLQFLGSEQVIYKVNGTNTSFSELMGLPDSQLDATYWFPWYNNVDLDTQLRFGNASSSTATVRVYIGGVEMTGSPFTLAPGANARKSFAGINNGPVKIESTQNIVVAQRFIYKANGIPTSFSELMGLPDSQLDTIYWFPWYNNVDLNSQLRFGNASGSTASVRVYIGGAEMTGSPFTLLPNQSKRVSFAGVNTGPVKIESTQDIVVGERVIYKINGTDTSLSEAMGLPDSQLNTNYWLPRYNNVDMDTQLRFGNASGSTATVRVYIGGVEMTGSPFTLLTNQSIRVNFPGVNNGPVKIESDVSIVAAKRMIYRVNGLPTSFSEMMGLPESLLDAIYWFPWYNNADLDTRLLFVVP